MLHDGIEWTAKGSSAMGSRFTSRVAVYVSKSMSAIDLLMTMRLSFDELTIVYFSWGTYRTSK